MDDLVARTLKSQKKTTEDILRISKSEVVAEALLKSVTTP